MPKRLDHMKPPSRSPTHISWLKNKQKRGNSKNEGCYVEAVCLESQKPTVGVMDPTDGGCDGSLLGSEEGRGKRRQG